MLTQQSLKEQFPFDLVVVVSPHPDDSCIAVGGFLYRLAKEKPGCKVHVFVMTSGYRGVTDQYLRSLLASPEGSSIFSKGEANQGLSLLQKKEASPPTPEERHILIDMKVKIRRHEAEEEAKILSFIPHFMNLKIYDERTLLDEDRKRFLEELKKVHSEGKRHLIIYPSINDAHQTHILCMQLALDVVESNYPKAYEKWAYESPWARIHGRADIIIPLSEETLRKKVEATQVHRSQVSRTPYGDLVEGIAIRNAAVLSELLGTFSPEKAYSLGKYAEVLTKRSDRIIYL